MNVQELKGRIRSGELNGAYLFCGEEEYLSQYYLGILREATVTDAALAPFNHAVFDGMETALGAIEEAIKSPPMMSDWKLIEWRYPDLEHMRESERHALEQLAATVSDYPYAVLAVLTTADGLDPGTARRPSRLATRLGRSLHLLNFEISTEAQLLSWLKKHFDSHGIQVTPQTLTALLQRVGHSMTLLSQEVEKLAAYLHAGGQTQLSAEAIAAVTCATVECDTFALSNAITEGNRAAAYLALQDMVQRRVEPGVVLAMLERVYSDLSTVALLLDGGHGAADVTELLKWNAYKTRLYVAAAKRIGSPRLHAALRALLVADAASKSGGVSGYEPVELFLAEHL